MAKQPRMKTQLVLGPEIRIRLYWLVLSTYGGTGRDGSGEAAAPQPPQDL